MDILSHGLWAGAAGKAINLKKVKPLKLKWTAFWGVFPDLFAFTFAFAWMIGSAIFPFIPKVERLGPENIEPITQNGRFIFHFTHSLYNLSHSLIIFFLVFGLTWFIFRRPIWEMGAWLLHILMDIPSHSYQFFPTPFLWPVSDFKINGTHWGTIEFELINYSLILATYIVLRTLQRKKLTKSAA